MEGRREGGKEEIETQEVGGGWEEVTPGRKYNNRILVCSPEKKKNHSHDAVNI